MLEDEAVLEDKAVLEDEDEVKNMGRVEIEDSTCSSCSDK